VPPPPVNPNAVFLNIPYDEEFQKLYLAYIVGLSQLGFDPFITSGITGGERRLDKVLALIQSCRYSIHDLSRVEVSVAPPATPRFNMPLELGLTITWAKLNPKRHTWFLWESTPRRLQKSMSDLDGTDPYIHSGTVEGVLRELRNAFVRDGAPSVQSMMAGYRIVEEQIERILAGAGTRNLYAASVFRELCFVAENAAHQKADIVEAYSPNDPEQTVKLRLSETSFQQNLRIVEAQSPNDPEQTVKLRLRETCFQQNLRLELASTIAQYYFIVQDGMKDAVHLFQGLKRPLMDGDDKDIDKTYLVYSWRPEADFVWTGSRLNGRVNRIVPPEGCVFAVLVMLESQPMNFPGVGKVMGSIEKWNWVKEDPFLPNAPVDWKQRYDKKLWSR
jgi:hypothetical protein